MAEESRLRNFVLRRLRRAPVIEPLWDEYERMQAALQTALAERDTALAALGAAFAERNSVRYHALTGGITPDEILKEIPTYFWWHSIDLGNGIITPGRKTPEIMAKEFASVFDGIELHNKTVLDIGAWNGGFSVEALRRGAKSVIAVDHYTWIDPFLRGRETIELVRKVTGERIDLFDIDVEKAQQTLRELGKFDIILFLGVFYHLQNPIGVLQSISDMVNQVLVVESYVENFSEGRPAMMFYPGAELAGDKTNWWGPNASCLIELLQMVGFQRVVTSPGSSYNRLVLHAHRD